MGGLVLAYLLGLVLGSGLSPPLGAKATVSLISLLISLAFLLSRRPKAFGIYLLGLFSVFGLFSSSFSLHPSTPPNHVRSFISSGRLNLEGRIISGPEPHLDRVRLIVMAEKIHRRDGYLPVTGKVLLTVRGRAAPLRVGDRVRFQARLTPPENYHNPGAYDYQRALAFKGIFVRGSLSRAEELIFLGREETPPLREELEGMRMRVRGFIEGASLANSGVLKALALGQKGDIPQEVRRAFSRAGLAHILAISGLHVGIIGFLSFLLFRFLLSLSSHIIQRVGVILPASLLALIPVVAYALLATSAGFPIWRASIMAVAFFVYLTIKREKDLIDALILALFLILILFPSAIFSISFQLSFAAVLSIAWIAPRLYRMVLREGPYNRLVCYTVGILATSTAAFMGTAPLTAYHFNLVSPIGLLSNLVAIPWAGMGLVPVLLASVAALPLSASSALFLLKIADGMASVLVGMARFFSGLPGSYLILVTPNLLELVFSYSALFLFVRHPKDRWAKLALIILAGLILINWAFHFTAPRFRRNLSVTFLDVKHGDSALVRFPKGPTMLIDAGGSRDPSFDVGEAVVVRFLLKERIRRLDYVVATHPDVDHSGGLPYILKNFKVGEVWANLSSWDDERRSQLLALLKARAIDYLPVKEGDDIWVNGVRVQVLNPSGLGVGLGKGRAQVNNNSIVLRMEFGRVSFLFTGDIEREGEARILNSGIPLRSSVLKVPHHGGATSSTPDFLDAVRPSLAVVSIDSRNPFGLPSPKALKRYEVRGIKVYRTGVDGAVTVATDGERLDISTFRLDKR